MWYGLKQENRLILVQFFNFSPSAKDFKGKGRKKGNFRSLWYELGRLVRPNLAKNSGFWA